jgi:hypothetical protein
VPCLVLSGDPMGCHWATNANSPPTIPTKPKREPNQMRRLGSAVLRYDGRWITVKTLPRDGCGSIRTTDETLPSRTIPLNADWASLDGRLLNAHPGPNRTLKAPSTRRNEAV